MRAENVYGFRHTLLLLVLTIFTTLLSDAQRLFANTKFDLNPDLPFEDPPNIEANSDAKPTTVEVQSTIAPTDTTTLQTTTTASSTLPTLLPLETTSLSQTSLQPLPSAVPLAPVISSQRDLSPSTFQSLAASSKPTPLPILPPLITSPPINSLEVGGRLPPLPPDVFANGTIVIPTLPPPPSAIQTNQISVNPPQVFATTSPPTNIHFVHPSHQILKGNRKIVYQEQKTFPTMLQSNGRKVPDQAWFQEDFDRRYCPNNAETIGKFFFSKFPKNLLKNGREKKLADLLTSRLRACLRKERENHWYRMTKIVPTFIDDTLEKEREECLGGLIQEQIACINLHSFSCQFIQPNYAFRLLPTRVIVQEARFAENGAEKCQIFVQKYKTSKTPATSLQ